MNKIKRIQTPLNKKNISGLKAGDRVLLSGIIYTARDQAHLELSDMIKKKKKLPIDLRDQIIFYCGPTPSGKRVIGACGPTTSSRMDSFTGKLLRAGLRGMIGKGRRSEEVLKEIKKRSAVYFLAPAGAGAFLSNCVESCKLVAFRELGPEAMYRLRVKEFPLIVGIDSKGRDVYSSFR